PGIRVPVRAATPCARPVRPAAGLEPWPSGLRRLHRAPAIAAPAPHLIGGPGQYVLREPRGRVCREHSNRIEPWVASHLILLPTPCGGPFSAWQPAPPWRCLPWRVPGYRRSFPASAARTPPASCLP